VPLFEIFVQLYSNCRKERERGREGKRERENMNFKVAFNVQHKSFLKTSEESSLLSLRRHDERRTSLQGGTDTKHCDLFLC
jgi:hypothetical protein